MILLACAALASEVDAQDRDPAFVPAQGWILVRETVETVQADIASYTEYLKTEDPTDTFRIELHPQADGQVALMFPDGFPATDLAGLTGWVGSPCRKLTPAVASAWIVAQDGAAYYLESDPTLEVLEDETEKEARDGCREGGGVLYGASSAGQHVRYDIRNAHLVTAETGTPYRKESAPARSGAPVLLRAAIPNQTARPDDGLVLDTRTEPERLLAEAFHHCKGLDNIGQNTGRWVEELWFWLQAHRADVSKQLWNPAGRAAIAAAKATATTEADKACLSRLEREARIGEIIHE
ncbi:hypothetical protein [Pseudoxanthomonas sp. PXM02]|uniref:hypothetical protein n=1 Tax=Pseudoxanthomonas sp. PXM02 TaxID=2769294 RepID=UPI001786673E|nr:hypothetical protein [Pseudoxanthomonas sp. PXM02]MBD9481015.1 hypothetical protein [Pseudoxanthomonas sp. PXM02]